MDESEGDKLRKSMWKKNIKKILCLQCKLLTHFNSFGSSNTPNKKIMDIGPYSRKSLSMNYTFLLI